MPKSRFFELRICRRLYGSIFKYFNVVGPKATIMASVMFEVIQGHPFRYQSKARERLLTNLLTSLDRFQDMASIGQILYRHRVPLFNKLVQVEPLTSEWRNLAAKN